MTLGGINKVCLNFAKIKSFPRTFITWFNYSKETFTAEHLFPEHLFLDTSFTVNYFFDELNQSFSICNFFCSHSQV